MIVVLFCFGELEKTSNLKMYIMLFVFSGKARLSPKVNRNYLLDSGVYMCLLPKRVAYCAVFALLQRKSTTPQSRDAQGGLNACNGKAVTALHFSDVLSIAMELASCTLQ